MILRREFISLLGGAAAWPLAARAQPTVIPVIGFLSIGANGPTRWGAPFYRGLKEAGYVEGQNVAIEYRGARLDRLDQLATELVRRRVAVILASSDGAALAGKRATSNNKDELDQSFAAMVEGGAGALTVGFLPRVPVDAVVSFAAQYKIPTVGYYRQFALRGGLMSYNTDFADQTHIAAGLVGRILNGAMPADLPIRNSTKFDFVINLNPLRRSAFPSRRRLSPSPTR